MNKIIFAAALLFIGFSVQAQTTTTPTAPVQDVNKVVKFSELDHDFGKIPYGKPVEFELVMTNISSDSVKILNVAKSCGCTTPVWQPGPYAPGETFKVKIGFSGYADGAFSKQVTVFLNNNLTQFVRFHGETYKAPDNAAPANSAVQKLKPGNSK
jgi:hypothetical protein